MPPEKARKKATETLEIYAPLAHRLGIQAIKSELEDLSFAVLHPKLYAEIESLVKQRTPQREQYVQNVIDAVDTDLRELRIRGVRTGGAVIEVADNGVGFTRDEVPDERLGLRVSIEERIANAGGAAEIASQPGHGTLVTVSWPADTEEVGA